MLCFYVEFGARHQRHHCGRAGSLSENLWSQHRHLSTLHGGKSAECTTSQDQESWADDLKFKEKELPHTGTWVQPLKWVKLPHSVAVNAV